MPGCVGVGFSLRTECSKSAKLTLDLISGAGEMYDLTADPYELNNLFDYPAHTALQQELTAILMICPDDIRLNAVPVGRAKGSKLCRQ